jgi:hypothetical protein
MTDYSTRNIIDYAENDQGKELRDALYSSIHDKVVAHLEGMKKSVAQGLIAQEEIEQIDELSKKTLKSYVKKSEPEAHGSTAAAMDKIDKHVNKTGKAPSSEKELMKIAGKDIMRASKRTQGLARAQARLSKEEVEDDSEVIEVSPLISVGKHPVVDSEKTVTA